ncbi:hypothetical protein BJV82DRAFT_10419 [Fennellomyces sp. T-0311]|nr:hypothetical protein BJV82DRAFT_10419 [Fennellomyces sp. T-0311]
MTNDGYFFHTSPKEWNLAKLFILQDKQNTFQSFEELLDAVAKDLLRIEKKQSSLKEYIQTNMQLIQELKRMSCLHRRDPRITNNVSVKKIADTLNNNGEFNVVKNAESSTKRKEREYESDDNPYMRSPTHHPTTEEAPVPYEEYKRAAELPNQLVLTHGKKQYIINTPSRSKGSPHRPKFTKSHVESLQNYVIFATNALVTAENPIKAIYESNQEQEKGYRSLKTLGLYNETKDILEHIPFDNFPAFLWGRQSQATGKKAIIFTRIVKYALTSFHLLCSSEQSVSTNHERTFFVEYCIPGLLALSKTTNFLRFHWCEFELQAMKDVFMFENDFNMLKAPRRYLDALGKMHSLSSMESVLVEASSGGLQEDVVHTIEDSIKSIECATASLQTQAMRYKRASISTFKKLQVFSIHIIKNKMTLSTTMLNDPFTWSRIDLRSATIPTDWDDRICLMQYFELLAALMDGLEQDKIIEDRLKRENIHIDEYEGQSIEEYLALK